VAERPASPASLTIAGPAGALEALAAVPAGFDGVRAAVVCHPHPLHGGTMHNKVVHTLARTFEELGLATVRFNFRGVGSSEGAFDDGAGETEDARAVCKWARERWGVGEIWLAGFSFGAYVATRLAAENNPSLAICCLVTVAPPAQRFQDPAWARPRCRWLIVHGAEDDLVDVADVRRWVARMEPAPQLTVLEGVDHYFHGRLHELKDVLHSQLAGR
jgi:alpha/beta superfamily hydrolase